MICASEQSVIVDKKIYDKVKKNLNSEDAIFSRKMKLKKLERLSISMVL